MEAKIEYLLGLGQIEGIGDVMARKLLQHFGSAKAIFDASAKAIKSVEGIDQSRLQNIQKGYDTIAIQKELKFIEKHNIQTYSILSESYPQRLKEIPDAPFMLFGKGAIDTNHQRSIAIVGSRNNTPQGKQFTESLVESLAPYKPCIVSGLAYGIDIIAHKTALNFGLETIGVLAHGLDRIYPKVHAATALQMQNKGGLLTEYLSGTNPDKQNFPSRNRIVAGMCDATIVVETAEKGGAMITAKLALSYNRDVFAVPGRYNDIRSAGCNYLIKTNIAQLITDANDVATFLNWDNEAKSSLYSVQPKLFETYTSDEKLILEHIQAKADIHIDELQIKTGISNSNIASLLLQLEFENAIIALPGKRFRLKT